MARGSLQGSHPVFRKALALAEGVAPVDAPLLLFGEPGTGRESLALHIHTRHPAPARDLARIDCAGPDSSLCAIRRCLVNTAGEAGGTLILREIGDLSADGQEAVARLIDPRPSRVRWRLIATSSRDLAVDARQGRLRADLSAALSRIILYLPPLRQRRCDIPELVRHFLEQASDLAERAPCRITDEALVVLWGYDWPGNVAELEAVVTKLASLRDRNLIHASDLPSHIRAQVESRGPRPVSPAPSVRFRAAS
jgi:DNA-binding NtrC family response regulator